MVEKSQSVSSYLTNTQFTPASQPHVSKARKVASEVEDASSAGGDTLREASGFA